MKLQELAEIYTILYNILYGQSKCTHFNYHFHLGSLKYLFLITAAFLAIYKRNKNSRLKNENMFSLSNMILFFKCSLGKVRQ